MDESEDLNITLTLGQQPIPVTIRRDEEEAYRAAAKLFNKQYFKCAALYPKQGNDMYMCMAALRIALSLQRSEDRHDTVPFVESMRRMLDTADDALAQDAQ